VTKQRHTKENIHDRESANLDDDDDKVLKNGILQDGKTLRTSMFAKDGKTPNPDLTPVQLAIAATRAATQSFDSSLHRPGYRYGAATGTGDTAAAHPPTRFGVHDSAREDAYAERDREMADAWQSSKSPPSGAYPVGTSQEGHECTINGAPGTLQPIDGHQGWLRCVADDDDTNYSGDDTDIDGSNDSRTGKFDAVKAQQIKADAYAAYDAEVKEAYKRKG